MHKCAHTKTLSKHDLHCIHFYIQNVCKKSESGSLQVIVDHSNKGNNKITELRTILQRESPNS
jgi:hypothetical protein